jgi:hypothetical protein
MTMIVNRERLIVCVECLAEHLIVDLRALPPAGAAPNYAVPVGCNDGGSQIGCTPPPGSAVSPLCGNSAIRRTASDVRSVGDTNLASRTETLSSW